MRVACPGLPKPSVDEIVIDEKGNERENDRHRQGAADIITIEDTAVPSNTANSLKAIVEDEDEKDSVHSQGNRADEYYDALRRQSPTRLTMSEADLLCKRRIFYINNNIIPKKKFIFQMNFIHQKKT